MRKPIVVLTVLFLFMTFSFSSCASIFHSERMGNSSAKGRLDTGMCILGCIFFWPISWIVDFATGAIWIEEKDSSGDFRLRDGLPAEFTDAHPFQKDRLVMPANGKFSYSLPVRGNGAHVIDFRLVTGDGSPAASDTAGFVAEGEWKKIESTLTVNAGNAERGTLQITIDGTRKVEIPVEFISDFD